MMTNEQKLAVDKENTNIIVSAGAGSGKTFVLSERVIRKLKSTCNINEILILTFTNKAAGEMKDRIRSKIKDTKGLEKQLTLINNSYITTFDSFSLSIVKRYGYLLNLDKDISIGNGALLTLEQKKILDEIFDELYEINDDKFLDLIDKFTTKNDTTLKEEIIKISNLLDLKYNKEEYLKNYIESYYSDSFIDNILDDYLSLINSNIISLKSMFNEYDLLVDNSNIKDYYMLFNASNYEEIKKALETTKKPFKTNEDSKELVEDIKKNIEKLKFLTRFASCSEVKNSLLSTKDYIEVIIDIILKLDKRFNEYKRNNKCYDFSDIAKLAITLVKDYKEVKEELTKSFKEIMIDEYQDTSDLQEDLIKEISNNNVYVVGDIKQSIYRFRNANPYLFKEKYDLGSKELDIFKIDLTNNFRSRGEVVENINKIFSKIMLDEVGGANYSEDHIMLSGNKDYKNINGQDNNLEVVCYEYTKDDIYSKDEIEIFYVAQDIKKKIENKYQIYDKKIGLRNVEYSDFAILLDRSNKFDLIKKIFLYFNIPVTKYSSSNVTDSTELLLIKNIITLILKRRDNIVDIDFKYSFLSIARSYLFEYSDDEIFEMIYKNNYSSSLIDIIDSIVLKLDYLSLKEIIYEIIDSFLFYEKFSLVGDIKNRINYLLSIIDFSDTIANNSNSIIDLKNYIDSLIEKKVKIEIKDVEDSFKGVNLMTIHASKGLEFPICYFFNLDSKFNIQELNSKFLFSNKYGIISPYYKEGIGSTILKDLLKEDYLKEEISEKIRLFYVALTRCREKIIMVAPVINNELNNILTAKSFMDFLKYSKKEIETYVNMLDKEKLNLTKEYDVINKVNFKNKINIQTKKIESIDLVIPNSVKEHKRVSKTTSLLISKSIFDNMKFGTLIHEMFEYIDFKNPRLDLIENKQIRDRISKFITYIKPDKIINTYKEYEFKYFEDNLEINGIIDLIIEYEDKYYIVDYKLKNIDEEAYIRQLTIYKNYLSKITNKKIEVYLYSVMDEEFHNLNI